MENRKFKLLWPPKGTSLLKEEERIDLLALRRGGDPSINVQPLHGIEVKVDKIYFSSDRYPDFSDRTQIRLFYDIWCIYVEQGYVIKVEFPSKKSITNRPPRIRIRCNEKGCPLHFQINADLQWYLKRYFGTFHHNHDGSIKDPEAMPPEFPSKYASALQSDTESLPSEMSSLGSITSIADLEMTSTSSMNTNSPGSDSRGPRRVALEDVDEYHIPPPLPGFRVGRAHEYFQTLDRDLQRDASSANVSHMIDWESDENTQMDNVEDSVAGPIGTSEHYLHLDGPEKESTEPPTHIVDVSPSGSSRTRNEYNEISEQCSLQQDQWMQLGGQSFDGYRALSDANADQDGAHRMDLGHTFKSRSCWNVEDHGPESIEPRTHLKSAIDGSPKSKEEAKCPKRFSRLYFKDETVPSGGCSTNGCEEETTQQNNHATDATEMPAWEDWYLQATSGNDDLLRDISWIEMATHQMNAEGMEEQKEVAPDDRSWPAAIAKTPAQPRISSIESEYEQHGMCSSTESSLSSSPDEAMSPGSWLSTGVESLSPGDSLPSMDSDPRLASTANATAQILFDVIEVDSHPACAIDVSSAENLEEDEEEGTDGASSGWKLLSPTGLALVILVLVGVTVFLVVFIRGRGRDPDEDPAAVVGSGFRPGKNSTAMPSLRPPTLPPQPATLPPTSPFVPTAPPEPTTSPSSIETTMFLAPIQAPTVRPPTVPGAPTITGTPTVPGTPTLPPDPL